MILCYYIQLPAVAKPELNLWLTLSGFSFFDATESDSCTSGHCALTTLDEIEDAITGD